MSIDWAGQASVNGLSIAWDRLLRFHALEPDAMIGIASLFD